MITPDDERARAPTGPAFADAVTFAWGDPRTGLHGLARLGLGGSASVLALLFAGGEPVAATARGDVAAPDGADFTDLSLPGLATTVRTPLRAWTVAFDGGASGFELEFSALCPPVEVDAAEPLARVGGMAGWEQLCRVQGTARVRGAERAVHCLGQRSRAWGEPDWDRLDAARTLSAWLDDGTGLSVSTVRPAKADSHAEEAAWAAVLDPAGSLHVDEPRLTTTYDAGGHQRRAGLELWAGDAGVPVRAAGEVITGSTLDLGDLRLDASVLRWHAGGRSGVGRYDILRRA